MAEKDCSEGFCLVSLEEIELLFGGDDEVLLADSDCLDISLSIARVDSEVRSQFLRRAIAKFSYFVAPVLGIWIGFWFAN